MYLSVIVNKPVSRVDLFLVVKCLHIYTIIHLYTLTVAKIAIFIHYCRRYYPFI